MKPERLIYFRHGDTRDPQLWSTDPWRTRAPRRAPKVETPPDTGKARRTEAFRVARLGLYGDTRVASAGDRTG